MANITPRHTRMRRGLATIVVAGLLLTSAPALARVSVGTAYSLDDERVLYRERRVQEFRDGELVGSEVEYLTPEGEVFAVKTIRFDSGLTTPEFTFVDYREDFREGALRRGDNVELFSGTGPEPDRRRSELPEAPVIDAGFDRFIAREFDRLAGGERLAFDFAVPAEQRFVRFQVEKTGELELEDGRAIELRMRPANVLLRLLVDPIRMVYDERRRLLEFSGISDVRNEEGDRHEARIVFDYAPADGSPAPVAGAG